jgi:hypothetical protein
MFFLTIILFYLFNEVPSQFSPPGIIPESVDEVSSVVLGVSSVVLGVSFVVLGVSSVVLGVSFVVPTLELDSADVGSLSELDITELFPVVFVWLVSNKSHEASIDKLNKDNPINFFFIIFLLFDSVFSICLKLK